MASVDLDLSSNRMYQLSHLYESQPQESLEFFLPTRELALYLMHRLFYMPEMMELFKLRTQLLQHFVLSHPDLSDPFPPDRLDKAIEFAFGHKMEGSIPINLIYKNSSAFLNLFLQLAKPNRRFAELTYIFLYEYTPKIASLQKLSRIENFIITMPIDDTDYVLLVYDTTREKNILGQLPYHFLKPKAAVFVADHPQPSDLNFPDFDPEIMVICGEKYTSPATGRVAHFVPYTNDDYSYFIESLVTDPIYVYDAVF